MSRLRQLNRGWKPSLSTTIHAKLYATGERLSVTETIGDFGAVQPVQEVDVADQEVSFTPGEGRPLPSSRGTSSLNALANLSWIANGRLSVIESWEQLENHRWGIDCCIECSLSNTVKEQSDTATTLLVGAPPRMNSEGTPVILGPYDNFKI